MLHLAVLPIRAPSKTPAGNSFAQGLTDALNAQLSRLTVSRMLQVTAAANYDTAGDDGGRGARSARRKRRVDRIDALIDNALSVDVALVDTRSNRPLRTPTVNPDPITLRAAHGRRGYSHAGPRYLPATW
jgi:hypothetical protein